MKPSKLGCALSSPSTAGESQHLPQRQPGELVCVPLTMISAQSTRTGCRNHPGIWKHSVMVERGCVLSVLLKLFPPVMIPQQFCLYEAGGFRFATETRTVLVLIPHSLCLLFLQWGDPLFSSQILKDHYSLHVRWRSTFQPSPPIGLYCPSVSKQTLEKHIGDNLQTGEGAMPGSQNQLYTSWFGV